MTEKAVHELARLCYHDPALLTVTALDEVASTFETPSIRPEAAEAAGRLLRFFLYTPLEPAAISAALRLLQKEGLAGCSYHALARALRYYASWRPEYVNAGAVADCGHLESQREFLQTYFAHSPVPAAPHAVALKIRARLAGGPCRVLAIHNINDGQGDEMVRCIPLLQSFLDFNPALEVVIATRRLYLYDHPRVSAVSIRDQAAVDKLLASPYDVVIDFYERNVVGVNYEPAIEPLVRSHLKQNPTFLFLSAVKGYNHFLYHTVAIESRNRAAELGVDRPRSGNIYEPTLRLLAALGLPARTGEEKARGGCLLTATVPGEAARLWEELSSRFSRPVAVVNPFGGREPLKGYTAEMYPALADEIAAVIDEGFAVVLLPNGTPWGGAAAARQAAELVDSTRRPRLAVAPDPGAVGHDADHVMRCFKYAVQRADLAVTVEGWMAHMAYLLGKPYRLVMLPYSHTFQWHPYPASRNQRVVAAMSASCPVPPAPRYPRKDQLLFVIEGLRLAQAEDAIPGLLAALRSRDRFVREAAARSLGCHIHRAPSFDALVESLKDKSGLVRRAASTAFLDHRIDLASQLGAQYETILRCHCWIVEGQWERLLAAGNSALFPLCVAMDDEDEMIRGEAAWAFQKLAAGKLTGSR